MFACREHRAHVQSIIASNGKFVTAGLDAEVRVWTNAGGCRSHLLPGHTAPVFGLALFDSTAAGSSAWLVASGGWDQTIRLRRFPSGDALQTITGIGKSVMGVVFGDSGRSLYSFGWDGELQRFDVATGRVLMTYLGHRGTVSDLAISQDGRTMVSAGADGQALRWRTSSSKPVSALEGHGGECMAVELSRAGDVAFTAGVDGTVQRWRLGHRVASNEEQVVMKAKGVVWNLLLSPDEQLLAVSSGDGFVRLLSTASDLHLGAVDSAAHGRGSMAFNADGSKLAIIARSEREVAILDLGDKSKQLSESEIKRARSATPWEAVGKELRRRER